MDFATKNRAIFANQPVSKENPLLITPSGCGTAKNHTDVLKIQTKPENHCFPRSTAFGKVIPPDPMRAA